MRISCVGAGPAGLYFAIVMKRRNPNHEIVVHERNPAGTTHGWGVVFWDDLLATLRTNDPDSAQAIADQAVPWSGQVVDVEGQPPLHYVDGGYGICRRRLLQILIERALALGVDVRFESEISALSQVADADLVVAADGVASRLRRHRADQFRPQIEAGRNKYIWLATTQPFPSFTFGFVPTRTSTPHRFRALIPARLGLAPRMAPVPSSMFVPMVLDPFPAIAAASPRGPRGSGPGARGACHSVVGPCFRS